VFEDARGGVHLSDTPLHEGFRPYRSAAAPHREAEPLAPAVAPRLRSRAWDGIIVRVSRTHEVSPAVLKAMIHTESAFDPQAVSPRGAAGLMQLMPGTAEALGVDDPFDPWQNIDAGTRYLRYLLGRYKELDLALAAYNAGETAVRRFGGIPPYPETRKYVKRILALAERYDADFR
jgi:soluble lytic murein transglycosylase-like protein